MMTGWGEMTLGAWLWMGIWVVALVAMVWLLVRDTTAHRHAEEPEQILRARFARGEISPVEFEQALRLLTAEKETHP